VTIMCNVSGFKEGVEQDFEWSMYLPSASDREIRIVSTTQTNYAYAVYAQRANSEEIYVERLSGDSAVLHITKVEAKDQGLFECYTPNTDGRYLGSYSARTNLTGESRSTHTHCQHTDESPAITYPVVCLIKVLDTKPTRVRRVRKFVAICQTHLFRYTKGGEVPAPPRQRCNIRVPEQQYSSKRLLSLYRPSGGMPSCAEDEVTHLSRMSSPCFVDWPCVRLVSVCACKRACLVSSLPPPRCTSPMRRFQLIRPSGPIPPQVAPFVLSAGVRRQWKMLSISYLAPFK